MLSAITRVSNMQRVSYFLTLMFVVCGCSFAAKKAEVLSPQKELLLEDVPQFSIGYCWQMPGGRKAKHNPDDREVVVAIADLSSQGTIVIRDKDNLLPSYLSDTFIFKSGCVGNGNDVRYIGNAISIGPQNKEISFTSGSDTTLTNFTFYELNQTDLGYNEVQISHIIDHTNYFF